MRDTSIDFSRGLLTVSMVWGHTIQLFGDQIGQAALPWLIFIMGIPVFPCFLFCFGRTVKLAYLRKPFNVAAPRILKTAVRTLLAFYISGIAYRLLCDHRPLDMSTIGAVLSLFDVPDYSEFLASFAAYSFLILLLFPLLKKLEEKPWIFVFSLLGILCCKLPYMKITSPHLGIMVGGVGYAFFPVVQNLPYFIAGIVYDRNDKRTNRILVISALFCTALALAWMLRYKVLAPNRFPPHWAWVTLPAIVAVALTVFAHKLSDLSGRTENKLFQKVYMFFVEVGAQSLFYLLISNLILFAMKGAGMTPDVGLGFGWGFVLVAITRYMTGLVSRVQTKKVSQKA